MSDDIIKRLRDAIAAGPTPGPWEASCDEDGEWGINNGGQFVTYAFPNRTGEAEATAKHIAAASPDNIAALLDRLDKAERENERLRAENEKLRGEHSMMQVLLLSAQESSREDYADAQRYRWLRDRMNWRSDKDGGYQWYLPRLTSERICAAENKLIDAAIDAAMAAEKCQCDMRTRLVGDGCQYCNPELARELSDERREG